MRGQAIVDGQPVAADSVSATFQPGTWEGGYEYPPYTWRQDTVTVREDFVRDRHGNLIPFRVVASDSLVQALHPDADVGSEAARTFVWARGRTGANPTLDGDFVEGEFPLVTMHGDTVPAVYAVAVHGTSIMYLFEGQESYR